MSISWTPLANSSPRDVSIGLDFGTGAIRAAYTEGGRPPEQIPMGQTHDPTGKLISSYMLPVLVWFKGLGEFELLLHRDVSDFENTASGAKQSMDFNLCQDGGQGERFMSLCKKHEIQNWAVVFALLRATLEQIFKYFGSKDRCNIRRVGMTVPVIWTLDSHGDAIQKELESVAISAGFPECKISFETEPGSAITYLALKYGKKSGRRRVFLIDIGAGTVDFAAAEIEDERILLISDPRGCSGGMADGWAALQELCLKRTRDADTAQVLFQAARQHVYSLGETCEPFTLGGQTISAKELQEIIDNSYGRAIQMAHRELRKIPNLDVVTISGSATASNLYIENLWRREIEKARRAIDKRGGKSDFKVDVLDPDDAAKAVCMGAAIPYPEDPADEFRERCFGILCVDDRAGKAPKDMTSGKMIIVEVKGRRTDEMESGWEKVKVHTTPDEFTIEPHFITHGEPLGESYTSPDTQRPIWPTDHAMPMNDIELNLSGLVKTGEDVFVRFTWRRRERVALTLEVAQAEGGDGWLHEVDVEIRRDRDRLFLEEVGRRPTDQMMASRERPDGEDPYEIPSDEEPSTAASSTVAQASPRKQTVPDKALKRPQSSEQTDKSPPSKRKKSFFEVIGVGRKELSR